MTTLAAHTHRAGTDPAVERLEAALVGLLESNRALLQLAGEHRRALAQADLETLRGVITRQNEAVQRVAEHERARQEAVGLLTGVRSPPPSSGVRAEPAVRSLSTVIAQVSEPARSRLLTLGDRLRELLQSLHREQAAIRAAAESLAAHMQGLLRQACGRLSHAGTYGRAGHVESRVQVVTALDVKQ